jgi:hypothetical protein
VRVRRLVFWWALALLGALVYAGADAALYPEAVNTTASEITFSFDKTEPFAFIHAGARLIGAYGWTYVVAVAVFGTGLIVSLLALFVEEEE